MGISSDSYMDMACGRAMSAKSDKLIRRMATSQALETVNEYIAANGVQIMDRAIQAMKGLPIEERQKIADAIIRGNEADTSHTEVKVTAG